MRRIIKVLKQLKVGKGVLWFTTTTFFEGFKHDAPALLSQLIRDELIHFNSVGCILLTAKGEKMLENETQCDDAHQVETFGEVAMSAVEKGTAVHSVMEFQLALNEERQKNEELVTQLGALKTEYNDSLKSTGTVRRKYFAARNEIDGLREELKRLNNKYAALSKERVRVAIKNGELEKENKNLTGECLSIGKKEYSLRQQLEQTKDELEQTKSRCQGQRGRYKALEARYEEACKGRTENYRRAEKAEAELEKMKALRNEEKRRALAARYGMGLPRQQGKSFFENRFKELSDQYFKPLGIDFGEVEKRATAFWLDEFKDDGEAENSLDPERNDTADAMAYAFQRPVRSAEDSVARPAPEDIQRMKEELDPHGTDAHSPGAKLDAGKNRLGLVLGAFAEALWQVGQVGTYGADKYVDDGWIEVPDGVKRYTDALYRHLLKYAQGEFNDPDTQLPHLAHAAWNALAVLELTVREAK